MMRGVKKISEKSVLKALGSCFILFGIVLFSVDSANHIFSVSILMTLVGLIGLVAVKDVCSVLKLQSVMASILLLSASIGILDPPVTLGLDFSFAELFSFVTLVLVLLLAFEHIIEGLNALVINSSSPTSALLVFNSLGMLFFTYLLFLDFGESTPQQMVEFLRLKLIFLGTSMLCFNYAVVGQLPELKFLGQSRHAS